MSQTESRFPQPTGGNRFRRDGPDAGPGSRSFRDREGGRDADRGHSRRDDTAEPAGGSPDGPATRPKLNLAKRTAPAEGDAGSGPGESGPAPTLANGGVRPTPDKDAPAAGGRPAGGEGGGAGYRGPGGRDRDRERPDSGAGGRDERRNTNSGSNNTERDREPRGERGPGSRDYSAFGGSSRRGFDREGGGGGGGGRGGGGGGGDRDMPRPDSFRRDGPGGGRGGGGGGGGGRDEERGSGMAGNAAFASMSRRRLNANANAEGESGDQRGERDSRGDRPRGDGPPSDRDGRDSGRFRGPPERDGSARFGSGRRDSSSRDGPSRDSASAADGQGPAAASTPSTEDDKDNRFKALVAEQRAAAADGPAPAAGAGLPGSSSAGSLDRRGSKDKERDPLVPPRPAQPVVAAEPFRGLSKADLGVGGGSSGPDGEREGGRTGGGGAFASTSRDHRDRDHRDRDRDDGMMMMGGRREMPAAFQTGDRGRSSAAGDMLGPGQRREMPAAFNTGGNAPSGGPGGERRRWTGKDAAAAAGGGVGGSGGFGSGAFGGSQREMPAAFQNMGSGGGSREDRQARRDRDRDAYPAPGAGAGRGNNLMAFAQPTGAATVAAPAASTAASASPGASSGASADAAASSDAVALAAKAGLDDAVAKATLAKAVTKVLDAFVDDTGKNAAKTAVSGITALLPKGAAPALPAEAARLVLVAAAKADRSGDRKAIASLLPQLRVSKALSDDAIVAGLAAAAETLSAGPAEPLSKFKEVVAAVVASGPAGASKGLPDDRVPASVTQLLAEQEAKNAALASDQVKNAQLDASLSGDWADDGEDAVSTPSASTTTVPKKAAPASAAAPAPASASASAAPSVQAKNVPAAAAAASSSASGKKAAAASPGTVVTPELAAEAAKAAEEVVRSGQTGAELARNAKTALAHLPEAAAAHALMRAVLKVASERNELTIKSPWIAAYQPALAAFCYEKTAAATAALYGLQVHFDTLGWPKGLLEGVLMGLYNAEVMDEDAFLAWKDDTAQAHVYPNKDKALLHSVKFFTWLATTAEEDEEDDEDEDSEVEEALKDVVKPMNSNKLR